MALGRIAPYFPLRTVDHVVELFRAELGAPVVTPGTAGVVNPGGAGVMTRAAGDSGGHEPDLALLSIVLGAVEHALTGGAMWARGSLSEPGGYVTQPGGSVEGDSAAEGAVKGIDVSHSESGMTELMNIELTTVEQLYEQFSALLGLQEEGSVARQPLGHGEGSVARQPLALQQRGHEHVERVVEGLGKEQKRRSGSSLGGGVERGQGKARGITKSWNLRHGSRRQADPGSAAGQTMVWAGAGGQDVAASGHGGPEALTVTASSTGSGLVAEIEGKTLTENVTLHGGAVGSGVVRGAGGTLSGGTSREVVRRVSDVIWASLSSSYYKDRVHIQSLYSLLTGNKLDCFGVALCVVAACQRLTLTDVHLCLSEDHSWVVFGPDSAETAEVTWHGKGVEDRRGQSVGPRVAERGWLYLGGQGVVCTRGMEAVAMVSSLNPTVSATTDSSELGLLQQRLLWLLYDLGHLDRYPMALCNLGDLEELGPPTPRRPLPLALYRAAIAASRRHYADMHVYPHTYLGGYLYRCGRYKDALRAWADAAHVISKYNYGREDQEVYKEFLEIATEIIPHIMRTVAEAPSTGPPTCPMGGSPQPPPLLDDPECVALLFQFYDGLCGWEEGSSTPVLHITWATHMIACVARFHPSARAAVELRPCPPPHISPPGGDDVQSSLRQRCFSSSKGVVESNPFVSYRKGFSTDSVRGGKMGLGGGLTSVCAAQAPPSDAEGGGVGGIAGGEEERLIQSMIQELTSRVEGGRGGEEGGGGCEEGGGPKMVALAHACAESILNPAYLRGGSEQPFDAFPGAPVPSGPSEGHGLKYEGGKKGLEVKDCKEGRGLITDSKAPGLSQGRMECGRGKLDPAENSSQLIGPATWTTMDLSELIGGRDNWVAATSRGSDRLSGVVEESRSWEREGGGRREEKEGEEVQSMGENENKCGAKMSIESVTNDSTASSVTSAHKQNGKVCGMDISPLVSSSDTLPQAIFLSASAGGVREVPGPPPVVGEVGGAPDPSPAAARGVRIAPDPPAAAARVSVLLRSTKMREVRALLVAHKLNTSALKLHLTAQSQVLPRPPAPEGGSSASLWVRPADKRARLADKRVRATKAGSGLGSTEKKLESVVMGEMGVGSGGQRIGLEEKTVRLDDVSDVQESGSCGLSSGVKGEGQAESVRSARCSKRARFE